MEEVKIIHTGDLHIGSSRSDVINGKAEIINTFFRIVKLCETERVDFLLISGDLFETPFAETDTVTEIIDAIEKIPETIVAISPGNHDCACAGSVYSVADFPKNVIIFNTLDDYFLFPQKNVCLFGAAFKSNFESDSMLKRPETLNPDFINICVLHGDIVSSAAESKYNPITASQIANCGFDYLALGHIHKRTEILKIGATFFSYCGCPDGRGFDEYGSRGLYLGTVTKGHCNLQYVEMSSRKYVFDSVDISDCETSLSITSKILSYLQESYAPDYEKNLYRISLNGILPASFVPNIDQIQSTIDHQLTYIQITDRTETDLTDIATIAKENSLRGLFVQKMLQMILELFSYNHLYFY